MENIHVRKVKEEPGLISNTIKIEPGFHMTFEDGIKEEPVSNNEDTKFNVSLQAVRNLPKESLDRRGKIRRKFCSPSLCLLTFDQSFETNCNCPTRPWPRPNRSFNTSDLFEAVPISPFKPRITKRQDPSNIIKNVNSCN